MKRGKILILLGILLGLVTTVGAFLILRGASQPTVTPTGEPVGVPRIKVMVAIQNISQGQAIDPAAVEQREFEQSQVPAEAVLNPADLAGKLAATDIAQGQILRASMITDKQTIVEKGIHASFLIPPGKVAVPFPLDEMSSVAYALQAGDHIDMLISFQYVNVDPETQIKLPLSQGREGDIVGVQEPRMVSQLVLQDIEILKIGHWGSASLATAVPEGSGSSAGRAEPTQTTGPVMPTIMTLLVDHQDALVLKYARETGASIDFALRGKQYDDIVSTEPVTLEYMIRRFRIDPPANLPYALEKNVPSGGGK